MHEVAEGVGHLLVDEVHLGQVGERHHVQRGRVVSEEEGLVAELLRQHLQISPAELVDLLLLVHAHALRLHLLGALAAVRELEEEVEEAVGELRAELVLEADVVAPYDVVGELGSPPHHDPQEVVLDHRCEGVGDVLLVIVEVLVQVLLEARREFLYDDGRVGDLLPIQLNERQLTLLRPELQLVVHVLVFDAGEPEPRLHFEAERRERGEDRGARELVQVYDILLEVGLVHGGLGRRGGSGLLLLGLLLGLLGGGRGRRGGGGRLHLGLVILGSLGGLGGLRRLGLGRHVVFLTGHVDDASGDSKTLGTTGTGLD